MKNFELRRNDIGIWVKCYTVKAYWTAVEYFARKGYNRYIFYPDTFRLFLNPVTAYDENGEKAGVLFERR